MKKDKTSSPSYAALMRYARLLGFGKIHTKIDPETQLTALIAVHNTQLGPAIGGTRFKVYDSYEMAFYDVLRLASQMTLKASISNLPHGGAKAVIIKPKKPFDRQKLLASYGDFVHELNGEYITAVDVGTDEYDMDIIAERTPFVVGTTQKQQVHQDPSPHTAKGVLRGIEAAVKYRLKRDNLQDLRVVIQGGGHVGYSLIKLLIDRGAKVWVSDPRQDNLDRCTALGAQAVAIDKIFTIPCDVFSPCALGEVLNFDTIPRIQASIVAGSANTQLAHKKFGSVMQEKNILYAPDFVINAGGLIYVAMLYDYQNEEMAVTKINELYDTLYEIFERADKLKLPTQDVAEKMAKEKLITLDKKYEKV